MKLSNLPTVHDRDFEVLGLVTGMASRSIPFFYKAKVDDKKVNVKDGLGGNAQMQELTFDEAKTIAFENLQNEGKRLLADEIINIQIAVSNMSSNTVEICVYGTAVKYKN